jgi:hypothetical protein
MPIKWLPGDGQPPSFAEFWLVAEESIARSASGFPAAKVVDGL